MQQRGGNAGPNQQPTSLTTLTSTSENSEPAWNHQLVLIGRRPNCLAPPYVTSTIARARGLRASTDHVGSKREAPGGLADLANARRRARVREPNERQQNRRPPGMVGQYFRAELVPGHHHDGRSAGARQRGLVRNLHAGMPRPDVHLLHL